MSIDYTEISRYNEEQLGKDRKSRMSQVAMYAESAHFIYELLQNADDAEATEISFHLEAEQLTVEHNGKPFTDEDIRKISYFGEGKTDVTKIGHFGLGFKSVFAYTASPKIYCRNDHFEITDLYTLNEVCPHGELPEKTRFVLPFDHLQMRPNYIEQRMLKAPQQAFEEIKEKLTKLGGETLLFTKTLLEISWDAKRESGHYFREDTLLAPVRQSYIITERSANKYFLVFSKPVYWEDNDDRSIQHRPIEIAYQIDKPMGNDAKIVGAVNNKLWVFFPTDIETHLGFILQGPYRTTPPRDNIPREDAFNQHLIKESASLLIESLSELKGFGLLDVDCLLRLPIRQEDFPKDSFFYPLYADLKNSFMHHALLPAQKGHISSKQALLARRAEKLIRLFDSENQLVELFDMEKAQWLDSSITEKLSPLWNYLTKELEVTEVRPDTFIPRLSDGFIEKQDEQWIIQFYDFLLDNPDLCIKLNSPLRKKRIIRLSDGSSVVPFHEDGNPQAYLPSDSPTELPIVHPDIIRNERAVEFLKKLGLSEPEPIFEVLGRLSKYIDSQISREENVQDIKKIAAVLRRGSLISKDNSIVPILKTLLRRLGREELCVLFENSEKPAEEFIRPLTSAVLITTPFLMSINNTTGEVAYKSPSSLYLSTAYTDDPQLEAFFDGNPETWFLSDTYKDVRDFTEVLLPLLNIDLYPRILKEDFTKINYKYQRGIKDYKMDGLDYYLQKSDHTIDSSEYLWKLLLSSQDDKSYQIEFEGDLEFAKDRNFTGRNVVKEKKITSICHLIRTASWLPDKQGCFHVPSELSLADLADGFDRESQSAQKIADVLRMKRSDHKKAVETLAKGDLRAARLIEEFANAIVNADDAQMDKFQKMIPKQGPPIQIPPFREAIKTISGTIAQKAFVTDNVSSPVQNPTHYQEHINAEVTSEVEDHQARLTNIVFKPIRETSSNVEARNFLYAEYTGKCQITGHTFAKTSGKNYFVAISLVSYQDADYLNNAGNMLCLCAECAAKFKYGGYELDNLETKIVEFNTEKEGGSEDHRKIKVRLAGEECRITYSERHFMRLKALWEKA